jgi:hypothetical protein
MIPSPPIHLPLTAVFLVFVWTDLRSQDTIFLASDKNSYIRFAEPVKLVDPGNQDYNNFIKDNVVFLKAKTPLARPTSLMVMGDKIMNVWIVKYSANPKVLVHYFPPENAPSYSTPSREVLMADNSPAPSPPAFQTEPAKQPATQKQVSGPTATSTSTTAATGFGRKGRDILYPSGVTEEMVRYVSGYKRIYNDLGALNARVKLVLNSVLLNDQYIFVVLDFINSSQIAYTIDFVGMEHRTTGGFRKRDTGESSLFPPVGWDYVRVIGSGDESRMVFIFKTYAWGEKDFVRFSMSEENGDRKLDFNFDARELIRAARLPAKLNSN